MLIKSYYTVSIGCWVFRLPSPSPTPPGCSPPSPWTTWTRRPSRTVQAHGRARRSCSPIPEIVRSPEAHRQAYPTFHLFCGQQFLPSLALSFPKFKPRLRASRSISVSAFDLIRASETKSHELNKTRCKTQRGINLLLKLNKFGWATMTRLLKKRFQLSMALLVLFEFQNTENVAGLT